MNVHEMFVNRHSFVNRVTLIMNFANYQINKQTHTVRELFVNNYTNSKP